MTNNKSPSPSPTTPPLFPGHGHLVLSLLLGSEPSLVIKPYPCGRPPRCQLIAHLGSPGLLSLDPDSLCLCLAHAVITLLLIWDPAHTSPLITGWMMTCRCFSSCHMVPPTQSKPFPWTSTPPPPLQCPSDPIGVDNSGVKYEPNWSFLVHVQAWPGQIRQQDTLMDTEFISSKNSTMKQSFFL